MRDELDELCPECGKPLGEHYECDNFDCSDLGYLVFCDHQCEGG